MESKQKESYNLNFYEENIKLRQENNLLSEQLKLLTKGEINLYKTQNELDSQIQIYKNLIKLGNTVNKISNLQEIAQYLADFICETVRVEKCIIIGEYFQAYSGFPNKHLIKTEFFPLQKKSFLSKIASLAGIREYVFREMQYSISRKESKFTPVWLCCGNSLANDVRWNSVRDELILLAIDNAIATVTIAWNNAYLVNLLEQKVEERTEQLQDTVEQLRDTQELLILENQSLRNAENTLDRYEYQVGGAVMPDSPTYVVRSADRRLYYHLLNGEFCYILNPRQMGKSSLRQNITQKLSAEDYTCANVDVSSLGTTQNTIDRWYNSLIRKLANEFQSLDYLEIRASLIKLEDFHPAEKFSEFIERYLLPQVKGKIVVFLEEIDSVRSLDFSVNDFFAALRYLYERRAESPELRRITFVLIGAARHEVLMTNSQITPFNIGQTINLEGFKFSETQPLIRGLMGKSCAPDRLMAEILKWTGGQPFLTQNICKLVVLKMENSSSIARELEKLKLLIETEIIHSWDTNDRVHFTTIRARILDNDPVFSIQLLKLYREIILKGEIPANSKSIEQTELILSGIVNRKNDKLRVYNEIYRTIFNLNWIDDNLNLLSEKK